MNEGDHGLELKVGIFVFVGLAILAALVVEFGRLGEGYKTYYDVTVHFVDASGLLKGSDVLMGGAKIGRVSGAPRLVTTGRGVEVPLHGLAGGSVRHHHPAARKADGLHRPGRADRGRTGERSR
jgi:phospholipid/cholesterol/gamma-HCH transport system substrate-binding protein